MQAKFGILLGTLLLLVFLPPSGHAFKRLAVGRTAQDFSLATLDGRQVRLSEARGEKATVVIFWAAWSPRSTAALCDFCTLYEAYGDRGLSVLAVDVYPHPPGNDPLATLVGSARRTEVPFPILVDEGLDVFDAYGVTALPSLVLLDSSGVVVELLSGYPGMSRDGFRQGVLRELGVADAMAFDRGAM